MHLCWKMIRTGFILEIMKECGVNKIKRNLMYRMVRMFGASHFRRGE